jgi:hypothetical protein
MITNNIHSWSLGSTPNRSLARFGTSIRSSIPSEPLMSWPALGALPLHSIPGFEPRISDLPTRVPLKMPVITEIPRIPPKTHSSLPHSHRSQDKTGFTLPPGTPIAYVAVIAMMMRSIAGILCVLYLSVSTVFAAVHHHDASALDDQQCAACSWHHDGTVDAPSVAPLVVRPDLILFVEEFCDCSFRELSLRIHPNRGPPLALL